MLARPHAWERFWVPRGTRLALERDAFLPDPTTWDGQGLNPRLTTTPLLPDHPLVILLGETAMGKSTAVMRAERPSAERHIVERGGTSAWVPLGSFSSKDALVRRVFESSDVTNLGMDAPPLHLYLDDFDECSLRIPTLHGLFLRELEGLGSSRLEKLRLRILCRTSVWSDEFGSTLAGLWGPNSDAAFELAPLRLVDVQMAAEQRHVDPAAFLDQVVERHVESFAARPLTLDVLLRRFADGAELPTSQRQIYEAACLALCEAYDPVRHGVRTREPRLTGHRRLELASRVAAAAMLSGREFVQRIGDAPDSETEAVWLSDLVGGGHIDGASVAVGEADLAEVFGTALFAHSEEAPGCLRWAHRSYAEYLAARHVVERGADLAQIRSLIVHPDDFSGGLIGPLHEVAAWLAGMRDDVLSDVIGRDPLVLLSSDAVGVNPAFRSALIDGLLGQYDAGRLLEPDWSTRRRFVDLRHGGLGEQLARWVLDRSRSAMARRVAVEIARACRAAAAVDALVEVALAVGDDIHVRAPAACAVADLGNERDRLLLLPLLDDPSDPEDELKGCALRALWPGLLPTSRLFEVLSPPRPFLYGAYASFLFDDPIMHLDARDLPTALDWVERQLETGEEIQHAVEDLVQAIFVRSTGALDDPAVAAAFAPAAWRHLRGRHHLFGRSMYEELGGPRERTMLDVEQRRATVEVLIKALDHLEGPDVDWPYSPSDLLYEALLLPSDVPWLLDRLEAAATTEEGGHWAQLVRTQLRIDDRSNWELVYEARRAYAPLREATREWFDAVDVDSSQAKRDGEMLRRLTERTDRQETERQAASDSVPLRIRNELRSFEDGDFNAFWRLNHDLTANPTTLRYEDEYAPDLTALPGWQLVDDAGRRRILKAGRTYLVRHAPQPDRWIGTSTIYRPDFAGYRALLLLLNSGDVRLDELDAEVWAKWAAVVLGYPTPQSSDPVPQQTLVAAAYRHAPDAVLFTLERLISARDAPFHDAETVLRRVANCWDDRLRAELGRTLLDASHPPQTIGAVIRELLRHRANDARGVAERWVGELASGGRERARALEAAYALALEGDDAGWSVVWPTIIADPEFGEDLLARLAWLDDFAQDLSRKLDEEQLKELYAWLERRIPEARDPEPFGMHEVTRERHLVRWRDHVLGNLSTRGTAAAVTALMELQTAFPTLEKIQRALVVGRGAARPAEWRPPTPIEVLALVGSPELRFVRNEDQLLALVVESVSRLQGRLQGKESPSAVDLWNVDNAATARETAKATLAHLRKKLGTGHRLPNLEAFWREFGGSIKGGTSPKEEVLLSDYVKRHLDDDLGCREVVVNRQVRVVSNREVENRPGELQDLRIEAFASDGSLAPLRVVVEVKGCWNPQLDTAMVGQLADRYLRPEGLSHGLYLVVWFAHDRWGTSDRRRAPCYQVSMDEGRSRLADQAESLAARGLTVRAIVLNASLPDDDPPAT